LISVSIAIGCSEYTAETLLPVTGDNRTVKTLRLHADPARIDTIEAREAISTAARILREGGLVALPTETVYGLGANALDANAVARIFAAKDRPSWDPIIVHIAGPVRANRMLEDLVANAPETARKLMAAFWPGPLTLLLPRSERVPDAVTAGRPLVGVRMPAHPVAYELIRQAGVPVAAPSANLFGHISPTTAAHVLDDLDGRIDAILDAGPTDHGVESTVLDPNQNPMVIYRPGAITTVQIQEVAGEVEAFKGDAELQSTPREALPSPGVGIRHYAPRARVILIEAPLADLPRKLAAAAVEHAQNRIGIMLPAEVAPTSIGDSTAGNTAAIYPWGHWATPEDLARNLYAGLRELDAQGCTVILCPLPPDRGVGAAIRDRLRKAAH
jgi:L-threonylcarbamoyladenylate synthase